MDFVVGKKGFFRSKRQFSERKKAGLHLHLRTFPILFCIGKSAISELIQSLADTTSINTKEIVNILEIMTKQKFGTDMAKWQSWWIDNRKTFDFMSE